jgi:hypothetical protein
MNTKVCEALDLPNWAKATAQEYLSGYEDQTNDNYKWPYWLPIFEAEFQPDSFRNGTFTGCSQRGRLRLENREPVRPFPHHQDPLEAFLG